MAAPGCIETGVPGVVLGVLPPGAAGAPAAPGVALGITCAWVGNVLLTAGVLLAGTPPGTAASDPQPAAAPKTTNADATRDCQLLHALVIDDLPKWVDLQRNEAQILS
jgi:hypothetical protein